MGLKLKQRDGVWYAHGTVGGTRVRKSLKTSNRSVAKAMADDLEKTVALGALRPTKRTWEQVVDLYLDERKRHESSVRNTQWWNQWFGKMNIGDVTPGDALLMLDKGGVLGRERRRRLLTQFNAVLAFAAGHGWCKRMAARRPRSGPSRDRWLDADECRRLLLNAPEYLWPLFLFMLNTGGRAGELLRLTWDDIDMPASGQWSVRLVNAKGDGTPRARKVPVNARAQQALEKAAKIFPPTKGGPVFVNTQGKAWAGTAAITLQFLQTCDRAGIKDARLHDLRRTFGSTLVNKGASLQAVSELMGHASVVVTASVYARLVAAKHQEVTDLIVA
jgi:integrase